MKDFVKLYEEYANKGDLSALDKLCVNRGLGRVPEPDRSLVKARSDG